MFKRKPKFDTSACSSASRPGPSTAPEPPAPAPLPYVKVALLGDTGVGKTSLLVRYTEGEFDEGQMRTQGINFMEQTVSLQDQGITFSIWDIGGHKDFESMLPLVCNEAAALIFVFDLTRPETLESVREWHRKARSFNRTAMPFLVGAKFDHLIEEPVEDHAYVSAQSQRATSAHSTCSRRPPASAPLCPRLAPHPVSARSHPTH